MIKTPQNIMSLQSNVLLPYIEAYKQYISPHTNNIHTAKRMTMSHEGTKGNEPVGRGEMSKVTCGGSHDGSKRATLLTPPTGR